MKVKMNDQSLGLQQSICAGKIVKIHRRQYVLKNVNRIIMFGALLITIFIVLIIFLSFFNPVFERIITKNLFFTFLVSLLLITMIFTGIEGFFSRIEKRLTNQLMKLYAPVDAHHVMSAISFSKKDDRPQYYLSRTLDLAYKRTLNKEAIEWPKLLWVYYHKNKKKEHN